MAKGKYGTLGKAASFLVAFLGIGFFATALDRFMGWNAERSGWKSGAVTLGTTLLLFVGLKAFKQAGWAKMALISGLSFAGIDLLARPVNAAGVKLADWMRSGIGQQALPGPAPQTPDGSSYTAPPQKFTGMVPTSAPVFSPTGTYMSGAAPTQTQAPQAAAPGQTTIIYQAAKIPKPDTLTTITGQVFQAAGTIFGSMLKPAGSGADRRVNAAAYS